MGPRQTVTSIHQFYKHISTFKSMIYYIYTYIYMCVCDFHDADDNAAAADDDDNVGDYIIS